MRFRKALGRLFDRLAHRALRGSVALGELSFQTQLSSEWARLRAEARAREPQSLATAGYKVYSQFDEDGILAAILERLGTTQRPQTCVEIGCSDGLENITHWLILQGFRGAWFDASSACVAAIEQALGGLDFPFLRVRQAFVDVKNVVDLFAEVRAFLGTGDPDVLAVDIDGNDLAVVKAVLTVAQPRVLVVEYNAKFPPPVCLAIDYTPEFRWHEDDYQGASLMAWCESLLGYRLVACSLGGVNAFFVRQDLAGNFPISTPADLFEPPRYHLARIRAGHAPTLTWLRQVVRR